MKSVVFDSSAAQPAPTVVYHRALTGAVDRYGKPARVWDAPVTVGDFILDVPSSEVSQDGVTVRPAADVTLFLPPSFAVAAEDKFTITHPRLGVGVECVPEGVGWGVTNAFTGAAFRTEVRLKVRRG
nr:MAG TPA: hypothetical protein [Caudoviricetes sp.]